MDAAYEGTASVELVFAHEASTLPSADFVSVGYIVGDFETEKPCIGTSRDFHSPSADLAAPIEHLWLYSGLTNPPKVQVPASPR